jgi:hypothetical protein
MIGAPLVNICTTLTTFKLFGEVLTSVPGRSESQQREVGRPLGKVNGNYMKFNCKSSFAGLYNSYKLPLALGY